MQFFLGEFSSGVSNIGDGFLEGSGVVDRGEASKLGVSSQVGGRTLFSSTGFACSGRTFVEMKAVLRLSIGR